MSHKLALYYFPSCPFCQRVLQAMDEINDIQVEMCDIHQDTKHAEKLIADTGRKTVPCLYIDGKPMHESQDIINWLNQNYGK